MMRLSHGHGIEAEASYRLYQCNISGGKPGVLYLPLPGRLLCGVCKCGIWAQLWLGYREGSFVIDIFVFGYLVRFRHQKVTGVIGEGGYER